jgi:hypothetical protein
MKLTPEERSKIAHFIVWGEDSELIPRSIIETRIELFIEKLEDIMERDGDAATTIQRSASSCDC